VAVGVAMVLNRALVWSNGGTIPEMIAQDLMLMGCISMVVSAVAHWWFIFSATTLLIGTGLVQLRPDSALEIFVVLVTIAFGLAAAPLFSVRLRRHLFPGPPD